jgi:hypothetical protein
MHKNQPALLVQIAMTLTMLGLSGCSGGVDKATSDRLLKLEEQNKQLQSRNASLEERLAKAEKQYQHGRKLKPAPSATGTNTTSDGNQINTSTTDQHSRQRLAHQPQYASLHRPDRFAAKENDPRFGKVSNI